MHTHTCYACVKPFQDSKKSRKFCSRTCYNDFQARLIHAGVRAGVTTYVICLR
jgi:protein-arginine kinase activator protein McsA